jgi:hypothetical protein
MKGLELSESYFFEHGLSLLEKNFSSCSDRKAVGLAGYGSECFGFDDEISRDHDWGPGFCLWLTKEDFQAIGPDLQKEFEKLPKEYKDFRRLESSWGSGRIGVLETIEFYKKFTGLEMAPKTLMEWFRIPEQYLATCTNGKVFHDPLGLFSAWRKDLLSFYPEDVRLKKIAARCMTAAQSGQYNLARSIKRSEKVAAAITEVKFCSDLMSLVFLLNRKYTPFYKWTHRALKSLPLLGEEIYIKLNDLISVTDTEKKAEIVKETCVLVIKELTAQGLSDKSSEFLLDHGPEVQSRIKDDNIRSIDVWAG